MEPNLHNTLLRVKRFGSEVPGQVYDYRTSQENAVLGQELDRWREGTLDGPSGKCTRNLPVKCGSRTLGLEFRCRIVSREEGYCVSWVPLGVERV